MSGGRWETMRTIDILRSTPGVSVQHLAGREGVDLLVVLSSPSPDACRTCCRQYEQRRAGDRLSDSQSCEHGIERRSDKPHSRFPLRPEGHRNNLPRLQRHCSWHRMLSRTRSSLRQAALTSSGKPPCFPTTLYLPEVCKGISHRPTPRAFYQRHCRFAIAGALLSRRLKVPLILEYNGPEGWIADHWDPTPFRSWIRLCEEVTLRSAARIIVVSEVLRAELSERGIPADRIRVNPNAVDPDYFYPGRGREAGRRELDVAPDEVLIGFAGSFSLWHGIEILAAGNRQTC